MVHRHRRRSSVWKGPWIEDSDSAKDKSHAGSNGQLVPEDSAEPGDGATRAVSIGLMFEIIWVSRGPKKEAKPGVGYCDA